MSDSGQLQVWRCPNCGRILAREAIKSGVIEVKCSCNLVATLRVATHAVMPADCGIDGCLCALGKEGHRAAT